MCHSSAFSYANQHTCTQICTQICTCVETHTRKYLKHLSNICIFIYIFTCIFIYTFTCKYRYENAYVYTKSSDILHSTWKCVDCIIPENMYAKLSDFCILHENAYIASYMKMCIHSCQIFAFSKVVRYLHSRWGAGLQVKCLGLSVWGVGFQVKCLGLRVWG